MSEVHCCLPRVGCCRWRRAGEGVDSAPVPEVQGDEPREGAGLRDGGLGVMGVMGKPEQQVGDQGGEDLDLHGVLGGADEAADPEVLLEPFEDQFDLPALAVECGDLGGGGAGWCAVNRDL